MLTKLTKAIEKWLIRQRLKGQKLTKPIHFIPIMVNEENKIYEIITNRSTDYKVLVKE